MKSKPTIGILGAGKMGTSLGRLAIKAGYPVLIAGSGDVKKIELSIEVLVPGAIPKTNSQVVSEADILILSIPLSKIQSIPTENIQDKIVIDTMNYWMEVDGLQRIPSDPNLSTSEYVAQELKIKHLVKAFNHMGYHDLEFESHSSQPKVIAYASDDKQSKTFIAPFIKDLGFEPLDLGPLKNGIVLESGSPLFGANLTKDEFVDILSQITY